MAQNEKMLQEKYGLINLSPAPFGYKADNALVFALEAPRARLWKKMARLNKAAKVLGYEKEEQLLIVERETVQGTLDIAAPREDYSGLLEKLVLWHLPLVRAGGAGGDASDFYFSAARLHKTVSPENTTLAQDLGLLLAGFMAPGLDDARLAGCAYFLAQMRRLRQNRGEVLCIARDELQKQGKPVPDAEALLRLSAGPRVHFKPRKGIKYIFTLVLLCFLALMFMGISSANATLVLIALGGCFIGGAAYCFVIPGREHY